MSNLPLFDFHLIDTRDILQTGLSWFWLTDGFYWMNIDGQKLFESSEDALRYWEKQGYTYPENDYKKCMDYQVVRFWEDMIEILPTIIQPVPTEFHSLFSQPVDKIESYYELYDDYAKKIDDFDTPFFFSKHQLSNMHIANSPLIYFWRYIDGNEDNMHIVWDFNQTVTDENLNSEIPEWSAKNGHYCLPYEKFMQEFNDFHQKLMDNMEEKILEIEYNPELQPLLTDYYGLRREHLERINWIDKEFEKYPVKLDWGNMIDYHKKAKII